MFVGARGPEVEGGKGGTEQLLLSSAAAPCHTPCLAVTSLCWVANDVISFPGSFLPKRVALVSFAAVEEEWNMLEQLLTLIWKHQTNSCFLPASPPELCLRGRPNLMLAAAARTSSNARLGQGLSKV